MEVASAASSFLGKFAAFVSRTPLADTSMGSGMLQGMIKMSHSLAPTGSKERGEDGVSSTLLSTAIARFSSPMGSPTLPPLPPSLPSTAVTSLLYALPSQSLLLVGCGDGRVVAVVDSGAEDMANKAWQSSLADLPEFI